MTDTGNRKFWKRAGIKAALSKEKTVHKNVLKIFALAAVFSIMQGSRRNQIHHPLKRGYFL